MAPRALRRALLGASTLAGTSALILLPALGAAAADYDVDDSGGAAYSTIQQAVDAGAGTGAGGDRILVAAGSYAGFTVNTVTTSLEIIGSGPATTTVTGPVTLNAETTISDFTIQGQATPTTDGVNGPAAITVNSGAAGSTITGNVIENADYAIYVQSVDSTSANPLTITDNTFREFYGDTSAGVFFSVSSDVVISGNTFQNSVAADAVGVNLICGSDNAVIDDNAFLNLANAVVVIANDGCGVNPTSGVTITNNDVDQYGGSAAFFFGPNNISDVTISGNTVKNTSNPNGAAVRFADIGSFAAAAGAGLAGITIDGNTFTDAVFGVRVQGGAVEVAPGSIVVTDNVFCRNTTADIQNDNADPLTLSGNIFTCSLPTLPGGTGGTGGGSASGQLDTLAVTGAEPSPAAVVVALLLVVAGAGFVVRSRLVTNGRHVAR